MIDVVTISNASTPIVAANPRRQKLVLCNNSDEDMYLAPGALAAATQGVPVVSAGGAWIDEPDRDGYLYKGIWTGICASGGKLLSVTELNRED